MITTKFALLITTMKKRKMDALPSLAGDMIEEILKKLRVKALIRFKIVCKSWHVLISSPRFHALQRKVFVLSRKTSCTLSSYCVSLIVNYSRSASLKIPDISSATDITDIPDELKLVFGKNTNSLIVVGSCNGVYLVCDHLESRVFALWNKATKDHKLILSQGRNNCEFDYDYGFGSEESVEGGFDFLVLKLCRKKGKDGRREAPQLYRSSTGFWKDLTDDEYNDVRSLTDVVYINGFFYWLDSAEDIFSLVSFDTRSETFEKSDVHCLNRLFRGSKFPSAVLTWYKSHGTKLLAIMIYPMPKQIDLWVMRESGNSRFWAKEATIIVDAVDQDNRRKAVADDPKADIWYGNVFQYEESLAKLS